MTTVAKTADGGEDSRWWRGQQMVARVEEARTADGGEFESWTVDLLLV